RPARASSMAAESEEGRVMRTRLGLATVLLACGMASGVALAAPKEPAFELKTGMRKLWEEHITYTRNYIISAIGGLEDADAVAQRLMKKQDEIRAAIKPHHSRAAGEQRA